jgi:hypothetical protein
VRFGFSFTVQGFGKGNMGPGGIKGRISSFFTRHVFFLLNVAS